MRNFWLKKFFSYALKTFNKQAFCVCSRLLLRFTSRFYKPFSPFPAMRKKIRSASKNTKHYYNNIISTKYLRVTQPKINSTENYAIFLPAVYSIKIFCCLL